VRRTLIYDFFGKIHLTLIFFQKGNKRFKEFVVKFDKVEKHEKAASLITQKKLFGCFLSKSQYQLFALLYKINFFHSVPFASPCATTP